jgi:hypothetical protein
MGHVLTNCVLQAGHTSRFLVFSVSQCFVPTGQCTLRLTFYKDSLATRVALILTFQITFVWITFMFPEAITQRSAGLSCVSSPKFTLDIVNVVFCMLLDLVSGFTCTSSFRKLYFVLKIFLCYI